MVSTRRYGRFGNALYMYAATIGYARKHGLEYSFPTETNDQFWNPVYFTYLKHPNWVDGREDILLNENGHHHQDIPFEEAWRDKQIVLNGYWQSWKYFDFCRDEVLKVFGFPYTKREGWCSVHVRRGDYLLYPTRHPVVSEDYLFSAVKIMFEEKGIKNFSVFSDDIPWCKTFFEELKELGVSVNFEYNEGTSELDDLVNGSCCEHNITSNSTFSVWQAELNQNPDKMVIVPHEDNWFGKDNKHLDVVDIYRPEWIRIKYA